MIEVPIYNQNGEQVDTYQLDEQKFGGAVRPALIKQAMVMYHANQRQGSVRTLARGEVAGSTKKMYRQKGTGNARMGSKRNPVRVGGGHAKNKRPKDWSLTMPKKQRRLATRSALLAMFQDGRVKVLDKVELPEAKTKHVAQMYKKLGLDRSVLLALTGGTEQQQANADLMRASRNLSRTTITTVAQLNAWDVLRNRALLLTKDGLEQIVA